MNNNIERFIGLSLVKHHYGVLSLLRSEITNGNIICCLKMIFLLHRLNGSHISDLKRSEDDLLNKNLKALSIMEDKLLQMQIDGGKKS